uniref:Uncharacterized protein n=1 Tax=Oryza sativa subsp. japonica TaxID=39947 RepID=Q75HW0_ORYSJ|nr:hypothetical protein [Oryza sativa Japonica Group]
MSFLLENNFQEQLSTRVGCVRVHSIIENILDKCGVIAPNLPTKTDDLSHSTGHGWTTREKYAAISHTAASIGVREIIPLAHWFSHQYAAISPTAISIGVREIIPLAHWFSHQYAAISHTAASIGVREIIPLAHWFSHQYAAISHTVTSIGVREIILLAHWFSHQYLAISRTLTSDGQGYTLIRAVHLYPQDTSSSRVTTCHIPSRHRQEYRTSPTYGRNLRDRVNKAQRSGGREREEGKREKRWRSTAHPGSTATTKEVAGAEEGGGAARVDGDDGTPAVDELGEVVDGVGGDVAKPEKATPRRETVPASGEGRPEVVGDGGERGRRCELVSGEEKMRQVAETGEGGSFWDVTRYDYGSVAVLVPRLQMIEGHLLTGSQPVDRSDISYIHFQWSSYDYCLVLDQRCSVSPTTSTFSGRVTTTAWSSTSDVASLRLLPLSVWSSYDYCLVLDQRCSVSPTTSTSSGQVMTTAWFSTSDVAFLRLLPLSVWSSYDYCLVLDQRCSVSPTFHFKWSSYDYCLVLDQRCSVSPTFHFKWSSYDYCLVLDQRCSVSPTISTLSGQWSSYDYYLVLDQRCSDSPTTSISTKLIAGSMLIQPRQVKGPRALSSENDSPTTRLGARESVRLYKLTDRSRKILFDIDEGSMSLWFYTKID